MAHLIDESTGRPAIAYVGQKPWHGLGKELSVGADIETWKVEAGLDWSVMRADVKFDVPVFGYANGQPTMTNEQQNFRGKSVLYRSDTKAPLSVMSATRYHIVQPAHILEFFGDLAKVGGFELEVAGALKGGKVVWATARINESANIIGHDVVRPFLLFSTSFDGTQATRVDYVEERVVCANTLAIAINESFETQSTGVEQSIKLNHSKKFDADKVRERLGIVYEAHQKFVADAQLLTSKAVSDKKLEEIVCQVIAGGPTMKDSKGAVHDVRESRGYRKIVSLFNGDGLLGADIDGGKSAWRLLNSVTQFVDHERGKNRDTGLHSAWFGEGSRMKVEAKELLLSL